MLSDTMAQLDNYPAVYALDLTNRDISSDVSILAPVCLKKCSLHHYHKKTHTQIHEKPLFPDSTEITLLQSDIII